MIDKEIPLVEYLFPNLDLTKFSKNQNKDKGLDDLTKNSKDANLIRLRKQYNYGELNILPNKTTENHKIPPYSSSPEDNEQLYIKSKKKINYKTRAGGLAWLRYRLDMAGVVGSNPTRPI